MLTGVSDLLRHLPSLLLLCLLVVRQIVSFSGLLQSWTFTEDFVWPQQGLQGNLSIDRSLTGHTARLSHAASAAAALAGPASVWTCAHWTQSCKLQTAAIKSANCKLIAGCLPDSVLWEFAHEKFPSTENVRFLVISDSARGYNWQIQCFQCSHTINDRCLLNEPTVIFLQRERDMPDLCQLDTMKTL